MSQGSLQRIHLGFSWDVAVVSILRKCARIRMDEREIVEKWKQYYDEQLNDAESEH